MSARRRCGACRECCITLKVDPTNSPAGLPCRHVCASGCGIYDSRPNTCREFTCGWREGVVPIHLSPAATKSIVWTSGMDSPNGASTMTVLTITTRNGFRINKKLKRWAIDRSHIMPIVFEQNSINVMHSYGRKVIEWHADDFVSLDFDGDRVIGGRVIPWQDVYTTAADRDAAKRRAMRKRAIVESDPHFMEVGS